MSRKLASFAAAAGLIFAGATTASANPSGDMFKGETITVYVGYGAGGGYDAYGRLLARHIVNHLPGKPQSIVRNMPGASSLTLMNYLATVAKKDGTEFGHVNASLALNPLIGDEASRKASQYDPAAMTWIGSLDSFVTLALTWHTSDIKTFEDTKKKEFIYGSSGGGLGPEMYSTLINEMFGTRWRALRGYRGSADISLAMERGEVPGFVGWCWECIKAQKPEYIEKNLVNIILQIGVAPHPELVARGVPDVMDLITDPQDRQVMRLAASSMAYSRPFVGPAGIPDDRKKALRAAFDAMVKDADFLAEAKKSRRQINPTSGEEIDRLIQEAYQMPKEIIERASKAAAQ